MQRQREGIVAAKARDAKRKAQGLPAETYKGRKPITVDENSMRIEVEAVRAGKQTHEQAMKKLGLKTHLSELGITNEDFEVMAARATAGGEVGHYVPLDASKIIDILQIAL